MPSLWRNGIRLGDIVARGPVTADPGTIVGDLEPTPAFTGIEPMIQSCVTAFPGAPTFQGVVERQVLDTRRSTGPEPKNRAVSKELKPLSEEEARGVPPEKLLEIRDDAGRRLQCDFISLSCFVAAPDVPIEEVEQHWGPGTREKWLVLANGPTPQASPDTSSFR